MTLKHAIKHGMTIMTLKTKTEHCFNLIRQ